MTKKPKPLIVSARIDAGKLVIDRHTKQQQEAAVKGWDDQPVEIEIRPWASSRSDRQNKWLWGVLYREIARETGYTAEDVHELMKQRHNSKLVADPGTGEELKIGCTTTSLTVEAFSTFIEAVMLDGSEWCGIVWPEPRPSEDWRSQREAA